MDNGVSLSGTLVRIAAAVVLVLATFNPTGHSLAHWIAAPPLSITPGKTLAVILLLIGWVVCLRTAFIALGKWGMLLGVTMFAAVIWLLVDRQIISWTGPAMEWIVLVVVGILLGVGLSWGLLRAKATGQIEAR